MNPAAMEPLPRTSPDEQVWRYLPLTRLLTAIETRRLSLTRLSQYLKDDPYETSVVKAVDDADVRITDTTSEMQSLGSEPTSTSDGGVGPSDQERQRRLQARRRAILRSAHASCWRSGDESEAMWRLYCSDGYGVAIRSTFQKLKDFINDPLTVVSSVAYIDYRTEAFVRYQFDYDPALHKRKAFEHEQEVRVLRFSKDDFDIAAVDPLHASPEHVDVEWNPEAVVDRVVLSPRCPDWFLDAVTREIQKWSMTIGEKVQPSDLAAIPYGVSMLR